MVTLKRIYQFSLTRSSGFLSTSLIKHILRNYSYEFLLQQYFWDRHVFGFGTKMKAYSTVWELPIHSDQFWFGLLQLLLEHLDMTLLRLSMWITAQEYRVELQWFWCRQFRLHFSCLQDSTLWFWKQAPVTKLSLLYLLTAVMCAITCFSRSK